MLKNLTKESVSGPGVGTTVTCTGPQPGFGSFAAHVGHGNSCFYFLTDGLQTEAQTGTVTMPPREMTATSVVPPPTSTTMLPVARCTGRPAPIAAAMGSSIR